jgi:hypothetical protein
MESGFSVRSHSFLPKIVFQDVFNTLKSFFPSATYLIAFLPYQVAASAPVNFLELLPSDLKTLVLDLVDTDTLAMFVASWTDRKILKLTTVFLSLASQAEYRLQNQP